MPNKKLSTNVVIRGSVARRSRGFTLVEVLLVMAIIGMIAGAVALTLPSSSPSERSPKDLAITLKEQLQYAREHAMVRQQPLGLHVDNQGYRFLRWYDGQWQTLDARGLKEVRWSDTLRWELELTEGNLMAQDESARQLLFQPDEDQEGAAEEEQEQEQEQPLQPQILILPSGEMTGFSLALDNRNLARQQQRWLIAQNAWQIMVQEQPYERY